MSSALTTILNDVKTALAACVAGGRVITRTYKEFGDRKETDLSTGIYTLLAAGGPGTQDNMDYVDIVIVGQGWISPKDLLDVNKGPAGEQIEEYEGAMLDEIYAFVRDLQGAYVVITGKRQSMQLESPYCWVALDLRIGPFGLAPDAAGGNLQPFVTYHQTATIAGSTPTTDPAIDIEPLPQ